MAIKKTLSRIALGSAALATLGLGAQACVPLQQTAQAITGIDLSVLGVQPTNASSYGENGQVSFSMFAQDTATDAVFQTNLQSRGMEVRVKNDDGTMSPCDHVGSENKDGNEFNTLTMLIDDSGSMGIEFPEDIYGDLCLTCPHDPSQLRAGAANKLAAEVLGVAPESRLSVMTFGPQVDEGYMATHVLTDFTSDLGMIREGVAGVDGFTEAGTPLWDSLADTIGVTQTEGDEYEAILRARPAEPATPADPADPKGEDDVTNPEDIEVKRLVVVISDGDDRDSMQHTLDSVIAMANEANVAIYAIGLGPASAKADSPLLQTEEQVAAVTTLQRLADETGGFYASVHDAAGLEDLYGQVAKSLTEGYQVETYSCKPKPTKNSPDSEKRVPRAGEKVEGDVAVDGGTREPWAMIAP